MSANCAINPDSQNHNHSCDSNSTGLLMGIVVLIWCFLKIYKSLSGMDGWMDQNLLLLLSLSSKYHHFDFQIMLLVGVYGGGTTGPSLSGWVNDAFSLHITFKLVLIRTRYLMYQSWIIVPCWEQFCWWTESPNEFVWPFKSAFHLYIHWKGWALFFVTGNCLSLPCSVATIGSISIHFLLVCIGMKSPVSWTATVCLLTPCLIN